MSTTELECRVCGETTSSFFIVIGLTMVCVKCKDKTKVKEAPEFQKPRVFKRYICTVHKCGTYSVNSMFFRHLMKTCDIKTQETLGIIRPATFGGVNGDIGRKNFLGINQLNRLVINLKNYKRFAMIHFKVSRKKVSYTSKKYYNKHLRFLNFDVIPDFHKYDETFKRLKFNYNVYMKSIDQGPRQYMLSKEERSKLYYKNLMKNFAVQVVSR